MDTNEDLISILGRRTWDKELILWLGPESKLRPLLADVQTYTLDLLDLFTPVTMPVDDDEVRLHMSRSLRQYLRSIPRAIATRTSLIVRSAGLLARYRVGVQIYDWFCDDFAMAILLVEGSWSEGDWPDEVQCGSDKLVGYFEDTGMVKRLIEA